jgi:hypothetical protein
MPKKIRINTALETSISSIGKNPQDLQQHQKNNSNSRNALCIPEEGS